MFVQILMFFKLK